MPTLNARRWYETLKFDTPSGDLGRDEYAVVVKTQKDGTPIDQYWFREHPENNWQPTILYDFDPLKLVGKTQVGVLPEKAHYCEYRLPDGRMYREAMSAEEYALGQSVKGHPAPVKVMSDADIVLAKKDDALWPEIK